MEKDLEIRKLELEIEKLKLQQKLKEEVVVKKEETFVDFYYKLTFYGGIVFSLLFLTFYIVAIAYKYNS
ncbi:hypothetical protein ACOL22_06890 [Aliarcobacter butzleri]